jgi:hypothetical protein
MKRRGFLLAPCCWYAVPAFALSSLNERGTLSVQGDRQLSLVRTDGVSPAVIRLDLAPDTTSMRSMPFLELDSPAAHMIRSGFENVTLMAQEHHFASAPLSLAVADDKGQWRMQPLPGGKGKTLAIGDMALVKYVVSRKGRHLIAGVSRAGMPSVLVLDAATGEIVGQWQAGTIEGEVSQLVRVSGNAVQAVINDRNRGAELVELNDRAQVLRRRTLPGGAASIAIAASGESLVAYRQDRQWFLTLLDRAWATRWTQPLLEVAGPGTRTLKLLSTGAGWMVAGGVQGQLFVQDVDADGRLGPRISDASGLLPPVDSNWHVLMVDHQPAIRGVSRHRTDLDSGAMTEFLWMPQ